jgi:hypothetical protein
MTNDWTGAHLISAKPSPEQRHAETLSLASRFGHFKRRLRGESMSQVKGPWARSIHADAMRAKAEGNA